MDLQQAQFIIASGPVIIENNKVLLNRHGEGEKDKLEWKFVGGRVENLDIKNQEQSLEEACRREVREEMGIEVEIIMPIKPMLISHPRKENVAVILIHYLAKRLGEIKPGDDICEWKWFSINNLPKNCAPNIKPVVEEYIKIKKLVERRKT